MQALAASLQVSRSTLEAHELLVERVAKYMCRAGRLAWRRLSLRANAYSVADGMPPRCVLDSQYNRRGIRRAGGSRDKVRRADLLADLRQLAKGAAYLGTACQCWYVLKAGIAGPEEIPAQYGVILADNVAIEVARPAPHRAMNVPFATWMALARCGANRFDRLEQAMLGAEADCQRPASAPLATSSFTL